MNKILEYLKYYKNNNTLLTGGGKIFDIITEHYIEKGIQPSYPLYLSLSVTSMCNGQCLLCSSISKKFRSGEVDKANPLLKKRLLELLENTPPVIFILSGGEPLLFPTRCKEYLEIFYNANVILGLFSNLALKLDHRRLKVIEILEEKPFSFIQTSIDTIDKNEHELLRKGTNLTDILSNIKYLKKKNIKIKVNTTISPYNYRSIMDVVKYVFNEGIESLHINPVLPFGRAKDKVDEKLCVEIVDTLIKVVSSREFNSIKEHSITFPNELIPLSYIGSKYEDILKVYGNSEEVKNKFLSHQFVCGIAHENCICGIGWFPEIYISLEDKKIEEAFRMALSYGKIYHYAECKKCYQYSKCDFETSYTGKCLMMELYNKIECILNYNTTLSKEESIRMKVFDELEKVSKGAFEVIIGITKECNGNCNFCQIGGPQKDTNKSFDCRQLVRFLKGNNYHIQITGGEPLIRKSELTPLIRELKKDGHIITLLTNLVLIDREFIELLKESFSVLDVVQVSIYAHNPQLHEIISGRNDWSKLNTLITEVINNGIQLRANLVLTKENLKYVKEIYNFYMSLGIKQISISSLIKKGRAFRLVDEKYIYDYIYYMYEFLKENNPKFITVSVPTELLKTYSNIKNNFGHYVKNDNLIVLERDKLYIHYNGNVYSWLTGELICNISENNTKNIILSPLKRDLSKSECARCHAFYLCKGRGDFELIRARYGNLNFSQCDLY
jgi:MoaA/NifB/PqqE/SkfB family radical SAM enzyme